MSNENEFINGLIVKAPNDNAPEYVKAKLSIRIADLKAWLDTRDGDWVNADIKVSQNGKWYAAVDNWKPKQGNGTSTGRPQRERPQRAQATDAFDADASDDIPFVTNRSMW